MKQYIKRNQIIFIILGVIIACIILIGALVLILQKREQNHINEYKKQFNHAPLLGKKNADKTIIVYADFNCPYCRAFDLKMMDKIKQKYINTDKANLRFVNASVLGDDSNYKSVVSYSLYEHTASNKLYWKLNRRFYEEQTKDKQHKTSQGLDSKHPTQNAVKSIQKHTKQAQDVQSTLKDIGVSEDTRNKIKRDINNPNSKAWTYTLKDKQLIKDNHIKVVPTVYIDNNKLQHPKDEQEYKQMID